jgi:hypothetical protein
MITRQMVWACAALLASVIPLCALQALKRRLPPPPSAKAAADPSCSGRDGEPALAGQPDYLSPADYVSKDEILKARRLPAGKLLGSYWAHAAWPGRPAARLLTTTKSRAGARSTRHLAALAHCRPCSQALCDRSPTAGPAPGPRAVAGAPGRHEA